MIPVEQIKRYLLMTLVIMGIVSCTNVKKKNNLITEDSSEEVRRIGNYVSPDYFQKDKGYDWVAVIVQERTDSLLQISIRSRADKKKPTCTFDANAYQQEKTGVYKALVEGNSVMFQFAGDSLMIKEDPESAYSNLNYFCSGGASIAGAYVKLTEPLDTAQIDKVVFRKSLNYNNYNFLVEVYGKTLTIEPFGLSIDNQKVSHQIEGSLMNAEVGDLNIDGFPEILVYIQSHGSGSYGSVIGYSVNNGKSMSQIYLPEISENEKAKVGYMGHDEFAIVENIFVQRFPVYKPGDVNAKPTGGIRQVQYKLMDGETSRRFVVDRIIEY